MNVNSDSSFSSSRVVIQERVCCYPRAECVFIQGSCALFPGVLYVVSRGLVCCFQGMVFVVTPMALLHCWALPDLPTADLSSPFGFGYRFTVNALCLYKKPSDRNLFLEAD